MQRLPTADEVRARIAPLDDLDRKVLGGLTAMLMAAPDRVRDREWLAQQFVQVAVVAHGFDAAGGPATTDDVATVQRYAEARLPVLLPTALQLFVRTAEDLRGRPDADLDAARAILRGYLAARGGTPPT